MFSFGLEHSTFISKNTSDKHHHKAWLWATVKKPVHEIRTVEPLINSHSCEEPTIFKENLVRHLFLFNDRQISPEPHTTLLSKPPFGVIFRVVG